MKINKQIFGSLLAVILLLGCNNQQAMRRVDLPEPVTHCTICNDSLSKAETTTLHCNESHKLHTHCLVEHAINKSDITLQRKQNITCPICNTKLDEDEQNQILPSVDKCIKERNKQGLRILHTTHLEENRLSIFPPMRTQLSREALLKLGYESKQQTNDVIMFTTGFKGFKKIMAGDKNAGQIILFDVQGRNIICRIALSDIFNTYTFSQCLDLKTIPEELDNLQKPRLYFMVCPARGDNVLELTILFPPLNAIFLYNLATKTLKKINETEIEKIAKKQNKRQILSFNNTIRIEAVQSLKTKHAHHTITPITKNKIRIKHNNTSEQKDIEITLLPEHTRSGYHTVYYHVIWSHEDSNYIVIHSLLSKPYHSPYPCKDIIKLYNHKTGELVYTQETQKTFNDVQSHLGYINRELRSGTIAFSKNNTFTLLVFDKKIILFNLRFSKSVVAIQHNAKTSFLSHDESEIIIFTDNAIHICENPLVKVDIDKPERVEFLRKKKDAWLSEEEIEKQLTINIGGTGGTKISTEKVWLNL